MEILLGPAASKIRNEGNERRWKKMKWYEDRLLWVYLVTACALPAIALAISIIALLKQ